MSKDIIVVGSNAKLVVQVMLSVYSRWKACSVVIGDEKCRPLARSSLCGEHLEAMLDGSDDARFVEMANAAAAGMENPILVPADCDGVRIIGRVRARLQAPSIPVMAVAQIDQFDDKWRFYQFCRQHDFNTPDTVYVGGKENLDFAQMSAQLGLPFVLKPINQDGSAGVHIVHSKEHFDREIGGNPEYTYAHLIAQRFVAGHDGGLSLFAVHGKLRAYAIQKYVKNGIDFIPDAYLEEVVHRFCEASAWHGVINLDVRLEEGTGKVYFTEANPRFWASTFASVWCGLNFVGESIEHGSGNEIACAQPLSLTKGHFRERRHPVVWPASWPYLLLDTGERGRMARAMTFDRYILPLFLASLPSRTVGFVKRRMFSKGAVTRPHA